MTFLLDLVEKGDAAAAAKSLQSCPTLCDPMNSSLLGSLSLGFSRQEHWRGLPFPSPMHESEKGKWSRSFVSDSWWPHGLQPSRLLHPWDSPGKSTGVGCHCLLQRKVMEGSQSKQAEDSYCSYWSSGGLSKKKCLSIKCLSLANFQGPENADF